MQRNLVKLVKNVKIAREVKTRDGGGAASATVSR